MSTKKESKEITKQYTRKTTSYKEAGKEIVIEEYKETIGEVETSDNSGTNIWGAGNK